MRANFALDYDVLTVERSQKLYLMAYLAAGPAPREQQRRPLNISLVIDRSGSMAGDKIEFTRQAAQLLVQNLSSSDLLSIVLYNDKVETLLTPEPVRRKDFINEQIRNIKPGGTTNLSGGWLQGCSLVSENLKGEALNRVILMSDGLANRGVTEQPRLVALAQQKREEGISTTTMGLGTDFNEDLMMEIASAGGGAFYFIESPEVAPLIFQEELQGLLSVVGQNLVVTVELTPHVAGVRQLNAYPASSNGRAWAFRMGDVFGDEIKALMLELDIPGLRSQGEQQIATLRFDYDELSERGTEHQTLEMPVMVNVAPANDIRPHAANRQVKRAVLLLKAAQARRMAVEMADKGQFQDAARVLREAITEIDLSGMQDDEQIAEERLALAQQAAEMDHGASKYGEYSRKTMSTQAFYTMNSRHEETMVLRIREQQRGAPPAAEGAASTQESEAQVVDSAPASAPQGPTGGTGPTPTKLLYQGKVFPLNGDLIRIGRSHHNEIALSVKGVSRFHCQLRREGGKLILEDVGSTNGTLINGTHLIGTHIVSVGDELRLCDERMTFS